MNDVGYVTWEEIDIAAPVRTMAWNVREVAARTTETYCRLPTVEPRPRG